MSVAAVFGHFYKTSAAGSCNLPCRSSGLFLFPPHQYPRKFQYLAKKQPNKIRVAFRKNRANIARQNDITRAVHSESHGVDGLDRSQRVSGRGNLTRRRTILGARLEGDQIVLDVDEAKCRRGRVLAAIGATQCTVQEDPDQPEAGRRYECTVRGVVRTVGRANAASCGVAS